MEFVYRRITLRRNLSTFSTTIRWTSRSQSKIESKSFFFCQNEIFSFRFQRFNGLDIERIFNEIPNLQRDIQKLLEQNQWLIDTINRVNRPNLSLVEIYREFQSLTQFLPQFERFQSE